MRRRHLAIIAAFTLGVTVVGGVALAASTPTQLQACANSKGALALLTSKGSCPSGFTPVAISKRGPKGVAGARGPRGKTGPAGPRGAAGTGGGAQSSIATTATKIGKSITLAGTKLAVKTTCTSGTNAKLVVTGAGDYFVHGVSDRVGSVTANADFPSGAAVIGSGSDLIDFEASSTSATATSDIALSGSGTGSLSTNLLLSDGSRTVTIDVFLMLSSSSCEAAAQITPTS